MSIHSIKLYRNDAQMVAICYNLAFFLTYDFGQEKLKNNHNKIAIVISNGFFWMFKYNEKISGAG